MFHVILESWSRQVSVAVFHSVSAETTSTAVTEARANFETRTPSPCHMKLPRYDQFSLQWCHNDRYLRIRWKVLVFVFYFWTKFCTDGCEIKGMVLDNKLIFRKIHTPWWPTLWKRKLTDVGSGLLCRFRRNSLQKTHFLSYLHLIKSLCRRYSFKKEKTVVMRNNFRSPYFTTFH